MLKTARNRWQHSAVIVPMLIWLGFSLGCGRDQQIQPAATEATATEDDSLAEVRHRALSDDAASLEEAFFHGEARAAVIRNIEPNSLGVGFESEFRVKRNTAGRGAFVYVTRVEYSGVTRNLVWWVPDEDAAHEDNAYPLNSPSKLVTPGLEFPARAGLLDAPDTADVVGYIFQGETMPSPPAESTRTPVGSFTEREYRIYQAVADTPLSVSDEEALRRVAKQFDTTPEEVERIGRSVLETLFRNGWFGTPAQEVRRASDWSE